MLSECLLTVKKHLSDLCFLQYPVIEYGKRKAGKKQKPHVCLFCVKRQYSGNEKCEYRLLPDPENDLKSTGEEKKARWKFFVFWGSEKSSHWTWWYFCRFFLGKVCWVFFYLVNFWWVWWILWNSLSELKRKHSGIRF